MRVPVGSSADVDDFITVCKGELPARLGNVDPDDIDLYLPGENTALRSSAPVPDTETAEQALIIVITINSPV